ncbi:tetratricopeptide repeat protein [Holosporaceae bacterium 'Namur']|nr:tetratricopeptide repeat protein [Holosporaceae bacterium 'Namur']
MGINNIYLEIIEKVKQNNPYLLQLDLRSIILTNDSLKLLVEAIKQNTVIGNVHWGNIPAGSQNFIEEIEAKIEDNNLNYDKFPSDYIHALLAQHVYQNSKAGDVVESITVKGETIKIKDWEVKQTFVDDESGYYAALYINNKTHQLVLAHKGTVLELGLADMVTRNPDVKTGYKGVLGGRIMDQQIHAYNATEQSVRLAKELGYNLSSTGHSLGGWFTEQSVFFAASKFEYYGMLGINFDGPGAADVMERFSSNIKGSFTGFDYNTLNIKAYLSAPNFVNMAGIHIGKVYRLFPEIEKDWYLEQAGWISNKLKTVMKVTTGFEINALAQGLTATLTTHKLEGMIKTFDPETELPNRMEWVNDWPKLEVKGKAEGTVKMGLDLLYNHTIGSKVKSFTSVLNGASLGGGYTIDIGTKITNIVKYAKDSLYKSYVVDTIHEIPVFVLAEVLGSLFSGQVSFSEYVRVEKNFNDKFEPKDELSTAQEFRLAYGGHYQTSKSEPREHNQLFERSIGIDKKIYKLFKYYENLKNSNLSSFTKKQLEKIINKCTLEQHEFSTKYFLQCKESIDIFRAQAEKYLNSFPEVIDELKKIRTNEEDTGKAWEISSYLPLLRDLNFTGRIEEVNNIKQELTYNKIAIISGFGGIGKTSLALEYAYQAKNQGYIVKWISADSQTKIDDAYKDIARELEVNINDMSSNQVINSINSKLKISHQKIIFVFDNVENREDIEVYIQALEANFEAVITTKDRTLLNSNGFKPIKLEVFNNQEAKKYLIKTLSDRGEKEELDELIQAVGTIPYHLKAAANYLNNNGLCTIKEYIALHKAALEKDSGLEEIDPVLGVLFKDLKDKNPEALKLLAYCSYLDPDYIPKDLLKDLTQDNLQALVNNLISLSLIEVTTDAGGVSIHREVQKFTQLYITKLTNFNEQNKLLEKLITIMDQKFPWVDNMPDHSWETSKVYANHAIKLVEHSNKLKSAELALVLGKLSDYFLHIELKYEVSLEYDKQALEIRKSLYKDNHPDIASSLYSLGIGHTNLGEHEKALEYDKQAFEMRKTLYKGNHPHIANSLHSLGISYDHLGDNKEALKYHKQAFEMRKALYKGNHPHIANSLHSLGISYDRLGDNKEALKYHKQAFEMRKALYKGNHPHIASSLNSLGSSYERLGDNKEALEYGKQALEMRKALYQGNHPDIATSLYNLGVCHERLGDNKEALEYYKQAFEMRKTLYKGNHPNIANSLYSLGISYDRFSDNKEALKYHKQAFEMRKALYKGNHPHIASSLNSLGISYERLGDNKEALEYGKQAFEMRKALYQGNHPDVASSLYSLGIRHTNLGEHEKALKYHKQAFEMRKALYKDNHPDIANSLYSLGFSYTNLGEHEKALEYYKQALEMRKALYQGNYSDDIAGLLIEIGVIYYNNLGEHTEAIKYLIEALKAHISLDNSSEHRDSKLVINNIRIAVSHLNNHNKDNPEFIDRVKSIGKKLLHIASIAKDKEYLKFVLEQFSPGINDYDCESSSAPLHYTAAIGSEDNTLFLIEKGADISIQNKLGETALHYAAYYHNLEITNLLTEKGADTQIFNNYNLSALQYSMLKCSEILITSSLVLKTSAHSKDGYNAFHTAASMGDINAIKMLLKVKADITLKDKVLGWQPIDYARLAKQEDTETIIKNSKGITNDITKLSTLSLKKLMDSIKHILCKEDTLVGTAPVIEKAFLAFGLAYANREILKAELQPFTNGVLNNIHKGLISTIKKAMEPHKYNLCGMTKATDKVNSLNEAAFFLGTKANSYLALGNKCEAYDEKLYSFNELDHYWSLCKEQANNYYSQPEIIL